MALGEADGDTSRYLVGITVTTIIKAKDPLLLKKKKKRRRKNSMLFGKEGRDRWERHQ